MKKHQPSPSTNVDELRRRFEQQNLGESETEALYAKVNKPPKEQRPSQQEETVYASPRTKPEAVYAPQRPPEGAAESAYATPPHRPNQKPLVSPYAVSDVTQRQWPEYDMVGNGAQDGRNPQKQMESAYAEIDFGAQGGRSPQKPVESIYATVGLGARDEHGPLQQENLIYQGVSGAGRTTPPPQTPKDEVTSKLLKDQNFQYGVMEIQERCQVVYGNRHALNGQLSKVLENPQAGDKILWDLAENPEGPGKLAGHKLLGVKSSGRKEAEGEFQHLCSAFERHVVTAQKLHKAFTREQERQRGPEREASPEKQEHKHHHHHRRGKEREQGSPEQETQRRHSPKTEKGMAFAM
ncbi:hypothetical protein ME7_01557 [Bartonella birtlesii LL-WM9]|uniref:Uncharacterized protein n=1 Tax=Bartonella birtlesii LL-WM9 TaxID=1094552 RepID=J0PP81_9HYPH|nr:BID domain-containing T4SS effector [Bartonella birtlesii]EJF74281.1 hypothetical protein ME7_01557 [Bartonella birtlesii LL-WM9]